MQIEVTTITSNTLASTATAAVAPDSAADSNSDEASLAHVLSPVVRLLMRTRAAAACVLAAAAIGFWAVCRNWKYNGSGLFYLRCALIRHPECYTADAVRGRDGWRCSCARRSRCHNRKHGRWHMHRVLGQGCEASGAHPQMCFVSCLSWEPQSNLAMRQSWIHVSILSHTPAADPDAGVVLRRWQTEASPAARLPHPF